MLHENSFGHMASNPDSATDHRWLCRIQFMKSFAKLINRDLDHTAAASKWSFRNLRRSSYINNLILRQIGIHINNFSKPIHLIARREGSLMNGIFGGAIRWCISQIKTSQVSHGRLKGHRSGNHINPLIDAIFPGGLSPQNAPRVRTIKQLQSNWR